MNDDAHERRQAGWPQQTTSKTGREREKEADDETDWEKIYNDDGEQKSASTRRGEEEAVNELTGSAWSQAWLEHMKMLWTYAVIICVIYYEYYIFIYMSVCVCLGDKFMFLIVSAAFIRF